MSEHRKSRNSWKDAPTFYIKLPRCGWCGHAMDVVMRKKRGSSELKRKLVPGYEIARTDQNGDGSVTQYAICTKCRGPNKYVKEIPTVGDCDDELDMIGLDNDHTVSIDEVQDGPDANARRAPAAGRGRI
jgi:hypothetical protein